MIVVLNLLHIRGTHGFVWNCGAALFVISVLGFLTGVPWTILRPAAGPHDRLSGTRVVPR